MPVKNRLILHWSVANRNGLVIVAALDAIIVARMKNSELTLIAALIIILASATWASSYFGPANSEPRFCEEEDNSCLLDKVQDIVRKPNLLVDELSTLYPALIGLCGKMSISSAQDACFIEIVKIYAGKVGVQTCSLISHRPQKHTGICNFRQAQILFASLTSNEIKNQNYEKIMSLCSTSSSDFRDFCFYQVAQNFDGDQARAACYGISMQKKVEDEITIKNCLDDLDARSSPIR